MSDRNLEAEDLSLWQIIGLPGVMRVASYLTTENAPVYRLIVDVMLDHQAQYLSGVQHGQLETLIGERLQHHLNGDSQTLAAALSPANLNLDSRLAQLASWGVVHAWEDKVRSDEDFTRHRGRYQLSEEAARLHRAVRDLLIPHSSSLAASLAPPVIAEQLTRMRAALEDDPASAAAAWGVITPTMQGMSDAATGWQARLASALSGTPDVEKINALHDALNGYIGMWGAGIDIYSADISRDARHLLSAPDEHLRHIALHLASAEASEETLAQVAVEVTAVLGRVLSWFDGPTSQAGALRRQMRDVIVPMVRGKRALAAVGGHVSRRNELLNLAERLDLAADDDAAWDVWTTYTGLFSAQHLGLSSPHPGHGSDTLSLWDAPPAPVEARLRRQGPRSGRGRPARMYDRTAGKEAARQAAATASREATDTWQQLLACSGRPLSQWEVLSGAVAEQLTDFVMAVDAALVRGQDRSEPAVVTTGDGIWELIAQLPDVGTSDAVVTLPSGRLVYTDINLSVRRTADTLALPAAAPDETPGETPVTGSAADGSAGLDDAAAEPGDHAPAAGDATAALPQVPPRPGTAGTGERQPATADAGQRLVTSNGRAA